MARPGVRQPTSTLVTPVISNSQRVLGTSAMTLGTMSSTLATRFSLAWPL